MVERRKKKRTQLSYEKVPATVGTGEEQQTRMKESSQVVLLTQGTAIVEVVAALL